MTLTVPLVGSHFRPPAKQVLAHLPNGTQLRLEPESENPYDANAIRVYCQGSAIPESEHPQLAEDLVGTGSELEEVLGQEIWLGYIGDSKGKLCQKNGWRGNAEVLYVATAVGVPVAELRARLGSLASGQAAVVVGA